MLAALLMRLLRVAVASCVGVGAPDKLDTPGAVADYVRNLALGGREALKKSVSVGFGPQRKQAIAANNAVSKLMVYFKRVERAHAVAYKGKIVVSQERRVGLCVVRSLLLETTL